jgi:membrane associated rhomboid family serine protease
MFQTYYNQYFKNATLVNRIIIINAAVFIGITVFGIVIRLAGANGGADLISYYLSASSDFTSNLFRPWGIITYQFTHEGLLHLAFNLIVFHFVGNIFGGTLGERKLLPLYLMGGVLGWLLYTLVSTFSPLFPNGDIPLIGASASVMAVMAAIATYLPNYKFRIFTFTVPLKYIALFCIAGDLASVSNGGPNLGGRLAHLGGAAFGFFYALQLKRGKDYTVGFATLIDRFFGLFNGKRKAKPKKKAKMKTYKNAKSKSTKTESDFDQVEIDRILDKISKSGYDSLTSKEKQTLFKAGNN